MRMHVATLAEAARIGLPKYPGIIASGMIRNPRTHNGKRARFHWSDRSSGDRVRTAYLLGWENLSYESGVVFSEYSFAWRSTTLFKSIPIALQSFSNASRASIDGTSDLRYCIHSRRLETAEQYDRRGKTLLKSTQECLPLGV